MKKWYWLVICLATLGFYGTSLRYGFSQDDFYFLLISRAKGIGDILAFFSPWHQQGFPFYRPLGTQLYYFVAATIAGFERAPLVMHIFMLCVQAANGYIAYKLSSKITRDESVSRWVGVLYATAGAQFLSLYYIAATQELLAAFFGLWSLYNLLSGKGGKAALLFGLALLSKENAIVVPVIGALLYQLTDLFTKKKSFLHFVRTFIPLGIVGAAYVALRFASGVHVQSEYQPVIGLSLISTARWYFLFAHGAPEQLLAYGLPGMYINFWRFIRDLGPMAIISTCMVIGLSITSLVIAVRGLLGKGPVKRMQVVMYYLWWLAGISLIIWFPDHRYPHYLDIGLVPLLILLMSGVSHKWGRVIIGSFLLVSSWVCIGISVRTHWTVKRAEIAVKAVDAIRVSQACQSSSVTFAGEGQEPQELSYVLSLANGPRYLCSKPDLGVYYKNDGMQGVTGTVIPTEGIMR